jgi:hypothetical protein
VTQITDRQDRQMGQLQRDNGQLQRDNRGKVYVS